MQPPLSFIEAFARWQNHNGFFCCLSIRPSRSGKEPKNWTTLGREPVLPLVECSLPLASFVEQPIPQPLSLSLSISYLLTSRPLTSIMVSRLVLCWTWWISRALMWCKTCWFSFLAQLLCSGAWWDARSLCSPCWCKVLWTNPSRSAWEGGAEGAGLVRGSCLILALLPHLIWLADHVTAMCWKNTGQPQLDL